MTDMEIIQMRDKWFSENYHIIQREVRNNIAKDGMSGFADDLIQMSTIQFLNKPLDQQYQMLRDNKVKWYILVTAGLNLRSSTSPFYNQIRKFRMSVRTGAIPENSTEDDDVPQELQDDYQCLQREFENLNFYQKRLIEEKFINGLTYKEIRDKYDITLNSLTKDIKEAIRIIKCKCKPNSECL